MARRSALMSSILVTAGLLLVAPSIEAHPPSTRSLALLPSLRGGADSTGKVTRKTGKTNTAPIKQEKKVIEEAMKEKDAAQALGDAIRERADTLRADPQTSDSIASVGWAMGTSDRQDANNESNGSDEGGGVEASKSSVLANYFLKSHGGAHALQSVCSLLAVACTLPALVGNPPSRPAWIQRCMLFAMTKHLSGLLAATTMCAKAIPEVGWRTAKTWMEGLALDPVSQYVFYAALVIVWLPATAASNTVWWWNMRGITLLLVGPILMREVISLAFVLSDVLLVLSIPTVGSSLVVDALMSLLVTPEIWRTATAAQRQAVLAKGTSRTSLVLEVLVGVLLAWDGLHGLFEFSTWSPRPSLSSVLKRCICARLYVHFLWTRKRSIAKLAHRIRGGASAFPFRVMDVLLHPANAMGLELNMDGCRSWKDYTVMALGLDED